MWRANVRLAQFDVCVDQSLFAVDQLPRWSSLPGEIMLLQLVKAEAAAIGKLHSRIEFGIVIDWLEPDPDGTLSRHYWPNEGRTWKWIVHGSKTLSTQPFSLEDLGLTRSYAGQTNPWFIEPEDQQVLRPFIHWMNPTTSARPISSHSRTRHAERDRTGITLDALLERESTRQSGPAATAISQQERFLRKKWLSNGLKQYYGYRCQLCNEDFEHTYGVQVAHAHHIKGLGQAGEDSILNMIVVCPNHHSLLEKAKAEFDPVTLSFRFRNGYRQELVLKDHFQHAARVD